MVKKLFSLVWRVTPPETLLRWQNTEKVTPRFYSRSILQGNKGPHLINFCCSRLYSERKTRQKQVSHSQKVWHTSKDFTRWARSKAGTDIFQSAFAQQAFVVYSK